MLEKGAMRICHITPLHESNDVRIFHKECSFLATLGIEVFLLVVNEKSRVKNGVNIIGKEVKFKNRWDRFRNASKQLYLEALKIDAEIYHFHDPEFLPFALKIKKKGKKVIYDVHEDVPRQILSKYWIPSFFRKIVSSVFEKYENFIVARLDATVCATDKISERFKKLNKASFAVKNYPIIKELVFSEEVKREDNSICYVGSITRVRGIVELVNALEGTNLVLHLVGEFSPAELKAEVIREKGWENVVYHGILDREGVRNVLSKSKVGVVTLYPIINYLDALPVKMFEYMAAGVAVLASDIELWKQIIEEVDCGMVVDPKDSQKIKEALLKLSGSDKIDEFGSNGQKAVRSQFNWEQESTVLKKVYEQIAEKSI